MADTSDSPANSSVSARDRRSAPRYTLIATAEIVDPDSGVRLSGRVSEISRKGCYLDLLNTLPSGTPVQVRISRDQGSFSSPGKIMYVHEGIGMGIVFGEVPADQQRILDSWLAELSA
jgi:hypothetical protein